MKRLVFFPLKPPHPPRLTFVLGLDDSPGGRDVGFTVWETDPDERVEEVGVPSAKQSFPKDPASVLHRAICETTELWGRLMLARQAEEAATIGPLERLIRSRMKQFDPTQLATPPIVGFSGWAAPDYGFPTLAELGALDDDTIAELGFILS